MGKKGFNTTNLHSDRRDNPEHGVLHKPVHPSVAYGYEDARHLAEVFQGKRAGYNYGRQLNPTVTALQNRIRDWNGSNIERSARIVKGRRSYNFQCFPFW